jgi:TP901-1 family phage major tail protein
VAGSGVFKNVASEARARAIWFVLQGAGFRLVIPDFAALSGRFVVIELSDASEHDGEATFAIKLASAGALSFAAG